MKIAIWWFRILHKIILIIGFAALITIATSGDNRPGSVSLDLENNKGLPLTSFFDNKSLLRQRP